MENTMKKQFLIATAAAALLAGSTFAMAQSPTAPQGSAEKAASDVKQAPRTGDTSKVGGTPSATVDAKQHQRGPLTENGAPIGSAAQQAETQKQAEGSGDSTKTGGTTTGNMNAAQKEHGPNTVNGAPVGSAAQKAEQDKQNARTGDSQTSSGMKKM
jgi:hypothetical protein